MQTVDSALRNNIVSINIYCDDS